MSNKKKHFKDKRKKKYFKFFKHKKKYYRFQGPRFLKKIYRHKSRFFQKIYRKFRFSRQKTRIYGYRKFYLKMYPFLLDIKFQKIIHHFHKKKFPYIKILLKSF